MNTKQLLPARRRPSPAPAGRAPSSDEAEQLDMPQLSQAVRAALQQHPSLAPPTLLEPSSAGDLLNTPHSSPRSRAAHKRLTLRFRTSPGSAGGQRKRDQTPSKPPGEPSRFLEVPQSPPSPRRLSDGSASTDDVTSETLSSCGSMEPLSPAHEAFGAAVGRRLSPAVVTSRPAKCVRFQLPEGGEEGGPERWARPGALARRAPPGEAEQPLLDSPAALLSPQLRFCGSGVSLRRLARQRAVSVPVPGAPLPPSDSLTLPMSPTLFGIPGLDLDGRSL
eukprot:EG_transcript_6697